MIALLRQPRLRRFFFAQAQSQLGTGAAYVALLLVAYQRLHSSWAVTLVLLADFLPAIVLAPFAGALADRCSRRSLAVAADLVRAGAFASLATVDSFGATVGFALMAGAGTSLFRPTVNAALPTLVAERERSAATGLYSALQNAGFTLGPALCGIALLFGSPTAVLLANALTFLVSALLLTGVPMGAGGERAAAAASAWRDTVEGVRCAARDRRILTLILLGASTVLCGAIINVAEPLLAVGPLHAGGSGFSILLAAFGIGMVVGSAFTSRLGSEIPILRAQFLAGVAVCAVATLACAAAGGLDSALAPFALFGFSNSLIANPENRLIQELSPDAFRGRVFGLRDSAESACFALAFIAAGGLLSAFGPRTVYALSGVLLLATVAVGATAFRLPQHHVRRAEPLAAESAA